MNALQILSTLIDSDDPYGSAPDNLAELHLEVLRQRFAEKREQIRVLDKRAVDTGTSTLGQLADAIPLLFADQTYKSYPDSFVEKGRWDHMNLWLQTLSAHPVKVPTDGVENVDQWMLRLREHGHMVFSSSGTSGKCTFMNHTRDDMPLSHRAGVNSIRAGNPMLRGARRKQFVLFPRYGSHRMIDMVGMLTQVIGEPGNVHYLSDEPVLAADSMYMGSMRRAIAEGTAKPSDIEQFQRQGLERQRKMQQAMAELAGKVYAARHEPIYLQCLWSTLYGLVQALRDQGVTPGQFHPDTLITLGGGLKGVNLPDDYREQIRSFFGIADENFVDTYGMTEMSGTCPWNYEVKGYMLPPWVVPLILDKSGEKLLNPADGKGVVEGRFAFFDPLIDGRWGGLITGDKVVIDFSPGHGLKVPVVKSVARYADLPEGDDKLSCAGTMNSYVRGMIEV